MCAKGVGNVMVRKSWYLGSRKVWEEGGKQQCGEAGWVWVEAGRVSIGRGSC